MKIKELSLGDILKNVKKNFKLVIIIFIACIIAGVLCGIINAKSYNPKEEVRVSQIQEHVDLESIEKGGAYYYNAFFDLKEKNDYIQAYLRYFEQVDVSNESRAALSEVAGDVEEYQDDFNDAKTFYEENAPVIYEKRDSAITFYNEKVSDLEKNKADLELQLEEIVDGNYTDSYKTTEQDNISENLSALQIDIDMFNRQINIIRNSTQEDIEETAEAADEVLKENVTTINTIIDDFNETLSEIAETDNYEIIYNKRLINDYFENAGFNGELEQENILNDQLGRAIIYAKSIAGLDISAERFFATITFFILFGVVFSVIIGAMRKPSADRK